MKDKFFAPVNLMQLEDTLKGHKPYAVLTVSTTGLDNNDFTEHYPTRINLKLFTFNEELKQYGVNFHFDKLVQAPKTSIVEAINGAGNYDVFANEGINKDAYIKGENVLSEKEFKREFDLAIESIKQNNSILIINGGEDFATKYLDKIDCGLGIKEIGEDGKTIDQTKITQEYFQKRGIGDNATLENLRNSLVSGKNTINTKIIGGDNRINVINAFITKYGRDEKILEAQWKTEQRESDQAYIKEASKKGKDSYVKKNLNEKYSFFIDKKIINPDEILVGKSEYHKLIAAIEGENINNKGIVIVHASSTGFEKDLSVPQNTGFPTQFTAIAYERKDGKVDFSRNQAINLTIEAPANFVLRAEERAKKGFDAFADAGIDLSEYKSGKDVYPRDKAITRIQDFFKAFPVDKYTLIMLDGLGAKQKDFTQSFTQTCISNLANLPLCNEKDYINMSQVIKEYAFFIDSQNGQNVLFNESAMVDKDFRLASIAKANNIDNLNGSSKKCLFVSNIIKSLKKQQEILQPEIKSDQLEIKSDEEETFIDAGYENVHIEKNETIQTVETPIRKDIENKTSASMEVPVYQEIKTIEEERARKMRRIPEMRINETERFLTQNDNDTEIKRLTEIVVMQSEMIAKQSATIGEMNAKLVDVLQQQNEVMRAIIEKTVPFYNEQFINTPSKSTEKELATK